MILFRLPSLGTILGLLLLETLFFLRCSFHRMVVHVDRMCYVLLLGFLETNKVNRIKEFYIWWIWWLRRPTLLTPLRRRSVQRKRPHLKE
jgi:hypothetical protein